MSDGADYLIQQLAAIRAEIAARGAERVTYRKGEVTAVAVDSFTADVGTDSPMSGITAPPQFLPAVGDEVTLAVFGATVLYLPGGIAENAITGREIAPGAVDVEQLAFELSDYTGGTTIFYGPDTPTATGTGDLWLEEPDNVAHRWDGNEWVEVRDQGVVSALQEAQTAQQVADQALADALAAQQLAGGKTTVLYQGAAPTAASTGDLWVKTPQNKLHRWDGDSWEPIQDTAISTALEQAATAQSTADGKVRIFTQNDAPTGLAAGDVGDLWVDTNDGNRLFTWSGTQWSSRQLGNSAIQPQSLIASNVIATGTVTAALLEALLVLASTIIVGNPDQDHLRLTPERGLVAYADDPVDGIPNEVAHFGRTYGTRDPITGMVSSFVDEQGRATYRSLATQDSDPTFGGTRLSDIIWSLAWGNVGKGELLTEDAGLDYWGAAPKTDTELGLLEFSFTAQPGRTYKIESEPFEVWADSGDAAYLRIRMTTDGSQPLVTTPWARQVVARARAGFAGSNSFSATIDGPALAVPTTANPNPTPAVPKMYRLLFTYGAALSTVKGVRLGTHKRFRFDISDTGPTRPDVGRYSTGGGATQPTAPPAPPPPPPAPRTTRTDAWNATWARSWREGGQAVSFDNVMYQGYGDSFNGRQLSACGFPDITGVLAGADIHKVELYLFCEHSWYGDGVDVNIQGHGYLGGAPALWPAQQSGGPIVRFGKGEGKWVDITYWAANWQNGFHRGISLAAPNGSFDKRYYGRMAGMVPPGNPKLRITYTK